MISPVATTCDSFAITCSSSLPMCGETAAPFSQNIFIIIIGHVSHPCVTESCFSFPPHQNGYAVVMYWWPPSWTGYMCGVCVCVYVCVVCGVHEQFSLTVWAYVLEQVVRERFANMFVNMFVKGSWAVFANSVCERCLCTGVHERCPWMAFVSGWWKVFVNGCSWTMFV